MREWHERNIPLKDLRTYRDGAQLLTYFSVPDPTLATLERVHPDVSSSSSRIEAVGPDGRARVLKDRRGRPRAIEKTTEPAARALRWRVGEKDWHAVLEG